tara:strand:+ start:359 stop:1057 length:699 start_codon:yes stop_codon:yes gene_type:complete
MKRNNLQTVALACMISFSASCCTVPKCISDFDHWRYQMRTGDGFSSAGQHAPITGTNLDRLVPGQTTEREFRAIFGQVPVNQWSYPLPPTRIRNGKVYRFDRKLQYTRVDFPEEKPQEPVQQFWSERLAINGYFLNGILQFYEVSHDSRPSGKLVKSGIGPLDNVEHSDDYHRQGDCDTKMYEIQHFDARPPHSLIAECAWYEDYEAGHYTSGGPKIEHNKYCERFHEDDFP